jgi:hypothetical protein
MSHPSPQTRRVALPHTNETTTPEENRLLEGTRLNVIPQVIGRNK